MVCYFSTLNPPSKARRIREISFFAIGLLAFSVPSFAQVYHIHHYTEADGLQSSSVFGLAQSQDGQIWFATRNGIDCYDGRTWQHYSSNNGLVRNNQRLLAIDSEQRIWAVSVGGGALHVSILEKGVWRRFPDFGRSGAALSILPLEGESCEALWT